MPRETQWPPLPYEAWKDTCSHLHLMSQIVGKVRLAQTPWVNHSWHVALYVTPRGLTTGPIPHGNRIFDIAFDVFAHELAISTSDGGERRLKLQPQSIAAFHRNLMDALGALNVPVEINGQPNEIPNAIPFLKDDALRPYDEAYVHNFWRALVQADRIFNRFRTSFLGKVSPVHLFWGGLDLAVTRFSGRSAPRHPGGIPALPDSITREAYSHEVSSAGFWPGGKASMRRSTRMPIRSRRAIAIRRSVRTQRISTKTWASSSCPMRAYVPRMIRIGCCSSSSIPPTKRQRTLESGIAPTSSAAKASPAFHDPSARHRHDRTCRFVPLDICNHMVAY